VATIKPSKKMKKIILLVALFVCTLQIEAKQKQISKHISIGDCDMFLNGTITYSLFPPGGSFTGSITFGPGCHGTQTGTISGILVFNQDGEIIDIVYNVESIKLDVYEKTNFVTILNSEIEND
jgi:hypothetical protein